MLELLRDVTPLSTAPRRGEAVREYWFEYLREEIGEHAESLLRKALGVVWKRYKYAVLGVYPTWYHDEDLQQELEATLLLAVVEALNSDDRDLRVLSRTIYRYFMRNVLRMRYSNKLRKWFISEKPLSEVLTSKKDNDEREDDTEKLTRLAAL